MWNDPAYVHQIDVNDSWTDIQIWEYAKDKNLTIITKDSDFLNKILLSDPPPKVIHIKIGNCKLKDLHEFLNRIWNEVLNFNKDHKLVTVYRDRIEGIKSNLK